MIGKHKEKLSLLENRNIETALLESASKLHKSFDVAVEASGSPGGFATALDLLKPRGKLVLKSTFQGKTDLEMWRVVVDEITIVGSRCGMFSPALDILKKKAVDVTSLIADEFSLSDGLEAMTAAARKGVMKVLLSNPER